MTKDEIKKLNSTELEQELEKCLAELAKLRIKVKNGSSKETHKLKELKRNVAQIKTLQRQSIK